jgi:hypothetical protein
MLCAGKGKCFAKPVIIILTSCTAPAWLKDFFIELFNEVTGKETNRVLCTPAISRNLHKD